MARLRIRSWLFYGAAALLFLTFFWRPDAPAVRAGRRRHVSVGVSRTLRAELDAFGGSAGKIPASAPRIAIISYDIAGPLLNGGIGTAYTNLACALGRAGLNVTLALALGPVASPASLKTWDEWVADFKARCSVVLTALPAPTERPHHGLAESERSFTAYNWLRSHENDFDVVHFHEWRGIGYHAQLAKHQGLHFLSTLFVVGTHSPSVWSSQGNMLTPTVVELQIDHMERESVRLADVLISPSRYMLEWMRQKHWTLPERLIVYPNIIDGAEKMDDAAVDRSKPMTEVDEFVFFGRLEPRKGLGLFIDAMLQLKERNNFLPKVTLLGKMSERTGSLVHTALQLFPHWKVLNNYSVDQAGEYLRQPGRVAVMPSLSDNSPYTILECIAKGIPFIASDVGGNGELLRAQDRWPVLFRTDQSSLAGTIALANEKGVVRAGPATSFKEVLETWVGWHANLPRVQAVRKAPSKAMVSIVLAIYSADRLDQVARSISWQKDYAGNVELIAVLVGIASEAEVKQCKDMLGAGSLGISSLQYVAMDDGNIGKAWNIGREKAKGSVLVFMENDAIRELSTNTFLVPST